MLRMSLFPLIHLSLSLAQEQEKESDRMKGRHERSQSLLVRKEVE